MSRALIILFLLPPAYFLYEVIVFLSTRVPHITTPKKRRAEILSALPITPDTVIYDLGSGLGKFLFAAEKFRPKKLVGFELSPLHAWYAQIKTWWRRSQVQFHRQNFFQADISEADIIYLFLVQSVVEKLWPKIQREAKPGAQIVVLGNQLPGIAPSRIFLSESTIGSTAAWYIYTIPQLTN